MTRVYYKEAVGAFVVFDVTRSQTFDAVTKWKTDLDTKVTLADGSSIPTVLLANKVCHESIYPCFIYSKISFYLEAEFAIKKKKKN